MTDGVKPDAGDTSEASSSGRLKVLVLDLDQTSAYPVADRKPHYPLNHSDRAYQLDDLLSKLLPKLSSSFKHIVIATDRRPWVSLDGLFKHFERFGHQRLGDCLATTALKDVQADLEKIGLRDVPVLSSCDSEGTAFFDNGVRFVEKVGLALLNSAYVDGALKHTPDQAVVKLFRQVAAYIQKKRAAVEASISRCDDTPDLRATFESNLKSVEALESNFYQTVCGPVLDCLDSGGDSPSLRSSLYGFLSKQGGAFTIHVRAVALDKEGTKVSAKAIERGLLNLASPSLYQAYRESAAEVRKQGKVPTVLNHLKAHSSSVAVPAKDIEMVLADDSRRMLKLSKKGADHLGLACYTPVQCSHHDSKVRSQSLVDLSTMLPKATVKPRVACVTRHTVVVACPLVGMRISI